MFLKRLELRGFKSFPNNTKIEFNKGVTAIVGPNGSGKSNILDAILWVFGEQSAKNLRGIKMEDVIFSGTESRRPMSFCEVSIVIDNMDKHFDLEYDEIIITRKAFRTGDSEYYINNKSCRLKDINELLMDSGIGKSGYSIISQGKVTEIVSGKGNDRRHIFDEAIGIVKMRSKKGEALSNLSKEEDNLDRVNDIISELELQTTSLKTEAEKANKFLELEHKLRNIEITRFVKDYEKLQEEINKIENDLGVCKYELEKNKFEFEKEEQNRLSLENTISTLEKQREQNLIKRNDINTLINNIRNDINLSEVNAQNIEKNKDKMSQEINKEKEYIKELEQSLVTLNASLNGKKLKLKDIDISLDELNEKVDLASREQEGFKSEYEKLNTKYETLITKNNTVEIDIERIKSSILFEEKSIFDKEVVLELNERKLKDLDLELLVLNKKYTDNESLLATLNKDIDDNSARTKQLNKQLSDKKEAETKLLSTKNETSNKIKFLKGLVYDNEGLSRGAKLVINKKNEIQGIYDVLSNLINVSEKYTKAIEITLGNQLQNIVVDNPDTAKKCIDIVKKNDGGRVTFLPVSSIRQREFNKDLSKEDGFLCMANDIIEVDKKFSDIVSSLVGNVAIFSDYDSAKLASSKHNATFRIVTIDGEQFNIGGSISGGSTRKGNNILSSKNELEKLKKQELGLTNELTVLQNDINDIIKDINISKNTSEELVTKYNETSLNAKQISFLKKSTSEVFEQCNDTINITKKEIQNLNLAIENKKEQCTSLNIEQQTIKEDIKNIDLGRKKYYNDNEQISEQNETILSDITANKILRNKVISEIDVINDKISEVNINKQKTEQKIIEVNNEIISQNEELSVINNDKTFLLAKLKSNEVMQDNISFEVEETSEKLVEYKATSKQNFDKYKEMSESLVNIEKSKITLEKNLENAREKIEGSQDYIWSKYELNYIDCRAFDYIEELIVDKDLEKKERALKQSIKELGSVNVNAPTQYADVKQRYDLLTTQREDIQEAHKNLLEIISTLTNEMESKFLSQFEVIEQNFNIVFREMFGGGEARLVLEDENDVLNSPILIKAQPPGKRLNHMTLLSGGEKALTAISLLFAILRMKDTPFCILDEVEAALDEANVKKYGDYLHEFAKKTQFIAITHRMGTMESSDTLYGVTMQEKGVSTLVSVEF